MITFLPAFLSLAVMVRVPAPGVEADEAQVLALWSPSSGSGLAPATTYTQVSLVAPLEVLRVDLLLLLLFTLLLLRRPTLPDATFKTFPPPCMHP